jgi:hypothetical protein
MLRISSVDDPLRSGGVLEAAMALVRRAAGLGLLSDRPTVERLDLDLIRTIARAASQVGVGSEAAVSLLDTQLSGPRLATLITRLNGALVESPVPSLELSELLRIYELDDVASLIGTSPVSLRRYATGARTMPDDIAERLHFLALTTSDLAGSYNELGLRRWWDRERSVLDGNSPRQTLGRSFDPDGANARAVATLAASLVGNATAS